MAQKQRDESNDKKDFQGGQKGDEQVPEGHEGGNLGLEQGKERGVDREDERIHRSSN